MVAVPTVSVPNGPGTHSVAVTPSDTVVHNPPLRALWIGGAGALAIQCIGDTAPVTLAAVPVGPFTMGVIAQVFATGTAATNIIGFY